MGIILSLLGALIVLSGVCAVRLLPKSLQHDLIDENERIYEQSKRNYKDYGIYEDNEH